MSLVEALQAIFPSVAFGRCWPQRLSRSRPAQAETVTVNLDQAQVMQLPDRVATIVIGNPLIADATLQGGGILVVTGKGYGSTNLLALDRAGRVLLRQDRAGARRRPEDMVVVYKGVEREILQLRSGLRAPHYPRRLAGLFQRHNGAEPVRATGRRRRLRRGTLTAAGHGHG